MHGTLNKPGFHGKRVRRIRLFLPGVFKKKFKVLMPGPGDGDTLLYM